MRMPVLSKVEMSGLVRWRRRHGSGANRFESMKTGPPASVARSGRRASSSNRSGTADEAKRPSGASVWFEEVCANPSFLLNCSSTRGEVSERFKEHAWKACVGEILPRVRIPLSPLPKSYQVWGAAQLEPANPARSGRKQR